MSKHSLNHSYFVPKYNFANEINAYPFRESWPLVELTFWVMGILRIGVRGFTSDSENWNSMKSSTMLENGVIVCSDHYIQ